MAIAQREVALNELKRLLAPTQVITKPLELITYEVDAGFDRALPDAAVFPQSTEDVVKIVRWAAANHVILVGRGAGRAFPAARWLRWAA